MKSTGQTNPPSAFRPWRQALSRTFIAALLCSEPGLRTWAQTGISPGEAQTGTQAGCYNLYDPSKSCQSCENGTVTTTSYPSSQPCPSGGVNPVNLATGDVQRDVQDLVALAGVGTHRLNWTRYGHSRFVGGGRPFGDGHVWRHTYQWEMTALSAGVLRITQPSGTRYDYTLAGGVWTGIASNPDVLTQSGTDYYLLQADGTTYHFQQLTGDGVNYYYQLQNFTDGTGHLYQLAYDGNRNLVLVSEPGGRWLRLTYQSISVNEDQWTTLAAIPNTFNTDGTWTEMTVTNPTAFRYLRYYSTDPSHVESYCNVAEVEFYDPSSNKLSGTAFGTGPAWRRNPNDPLLDPNAPPSTNTFDKAFDGDTGTFFDYAYMHFGYTGIDLGSGTAAQVGKVRFYPRSGFAGRMQDGLFQGANTAPVTETLVGTVEIGYGSGVGEVVTRTVNYGYTTMADTLGASWLVLSSATYGDGTSAQYTYNQQWPGQRPLLLSMDDPRVAGTATKIRYEFWYSAYISGDIYAERRFSGTFDILAKFEGVGADNAGNTGRKTTYVNGITENYDLGGSHHLGSKTDVLGRKAEFGYSAGGEGFLISSTVKDSAGTVIKTTNYTRDNAGRLLSITWPDSEGHVWTHVWTRDSLGFVLTEKDENDYTTTYTRDGQHRVTGILHPDGSTESYPSYNAFGQPLTHGLRNGGSESMDYNTRGLMTSRTDAAGKTTILAYNSQDLVETVKDANNNITSYLYNERGQVTRVTYPGAVSVNYAYDTYGNQTARTDELSATGLPTDIDHTWSATFDEFKRRTTATTPRRSATDTLPRTTTYAYDEPTGGGGCCGTAGAGDHLTTITLPSGKVTRFVYDLAWQKTAEITGYGSPDVATTQYFYNASGNMYQMIDANSKTTDYSYDLRNRRLTATDLLGQITRWTYDGVGSVLTVTRPAPVGGVTVNTYDTMNRLSTTTDPASQLTQYFYGGLNYVGGTKGDNLVRLKDARLNSHDFTYDAMNRKTSMIYPGGSHEDWGYDNVGNNNTYKNRAALTKTISYDTRNRETGFTWSDGSTPAVARTYDNASRLLTLNNANSALTYTYDFSGQLTGETQNVSGLGAKTVGYSYDADGNRATMTYPGGKVAGYTYTGRNQVDTITYDGPPPLVNYDYDLAGNRSLKTLENGTRTAYAYDDAERLTGVDHQRSSGGAWTSFQSFGYTLSSVGNRTDRYETNAGLTKRDKYSYLADDQLDIVKYNYTGTTQDRTVDYNYDAVGSRTTVADSAGQTPGTYAPNTLNQYTSVNGAGQGFDSNGNQTMVYLGSGSSPSYFTYDAQNRATSGYGMVPGGYNSMSLAYDARNRCVKRTSSGSSGMTTTYLVWDGWNLLAEFAGGSGYSYPPPPATELRRYVHGAAVDEILLAIAPVAAQTVHHVHDGLGNVTALTDASGTVVERYTYDVFGKATVLNASGTAIAGTAYGNRFLFTGREWIAELGMYDYRNRVYSASIGRFLQTDPLRFKAGDANLYRSVLNNPILFIDPFGLSANPCPCSKEEYDKQARERAREVADLHRIWGTYAGVPTQQTDELDRKYPCTASGSPTDIGKFIEKTLPLMIPAPPGTPAWVAAMQKAFSFFLQW